LKNKKLFIGIPNSQEQMPSMFFWSFIQSTIPCANVVLRAVSSVSAIRNNFLYTEFLKTNCDYFVKMDIDQVYPSDYFTTMLPLLGEYKAIGPLIYDRHEENGFAPMVFENVDIENSMMSRRDISKMSGIIEVPFCHANLFLAREVIEKISFPPHEGTLSADGLIRANHPDFLLNKKIHDAGYKIYVNLDVVVKHIAKLYVTPEVHRKWHNDG